MDIKNSKKRVNKEEEKSEYKKNLTRKKVQEENASFDFKLFSSYFISSWLLKPETKAYSSFKLIFKIQFVWIWIDLQLQKTKNKKTPKMKRKKELSSYFSTQLNIIHTFLSLLSRRIASSKIHTSNKNLFEVKGG